MHGGRQETDGRQEGYALHGNSAGKIARRRRDRISAMSERTVTFYRWNDMPKEQVADLLDRRLITGDRMMLAHVYLKKGMVVPRHQHENEQITYILKGALHFWIGEDEK